MTYPEPVSADTLLFALFGVLLVSMLFVLPAFQSGWWFLSKHHRASSGHPEARLVPIRMGSRGWRLRLLAHVAVTDAGIHVADAWVSPSSLLARPLLLPWESVRVDPSAAPRLRVQSIEVPWVEIELRPRHLREVDLRGRA